MCKERCFPAKVHTQVCLYWLILFPLLLKWSLLDTPSNSSLITAVLLANNKYWVNPIFPGFLSVSQNCVTPRPPPHISKAHCSSLFQTMKTITPSLYSFHSYQLTVQVSLFSGFKGLPETLLLKTGFVVKSFSKDSDFFWNLCFVRIPSKRHCDRSDLSVTADLGLL